MCAENQEFTTFEAVLAENVGVSRDVIKKIRRDCLDPGKDYSLVAGKVCLSNEAVAVVMGRLGLEVTADMAEPEKTPPASNLTVANVCRIWPINRHVLDARIYGTSDVIRVKVRDNMMFHIGQEIPVKKTSAYWVLGCRNPVKRGRLPWQNTQKLP